MRTPTIMSKWLTFFLLIIFCVIFDTLPQSSFALDLFGFSFDENAFSNDANLVSGQLSYFGFSKWGYPITGNDHVDLNTALDGADLYTAIEGKWQDGRNLDYVVDVSSVPL